MSAEMKAGSPTGEENPAIGQHRSGGETGRLFAPALCCCVPGQGWIRECLGQLILLFKDVLGERA